MTDTPLTRAARALVLSQSGVDDFDALDEEMQQGLVEDVKAVLGAFREPAEYWAWRAEDYGRGGAVRWYQDMVDSIAKGEDHQVMRGG